MERSGHVLLIGLDRVAKRNAFIAIALADRIASQAPLGVYATLSSARQALPLTEGVAAARLLPDLQPLMKSDDVQEGVRAFMERRAGVFRGR